MSIAKSLVLTAFFLGALCLARPAPAGDAFPLVIGEKTIELGPGVDREQLFAALSAALPGETPSVNDKSRIQYDYFAVKGEGPVTVVLDFDVNGKLAGLIADSFEKKQNPPAQLLLRWLLAHAGKGTGTEYGLTWKYGGMDFEFIEIKDAGEDSMYRIEMVRPE